MNRNEEQQQGIEQGIPSIEKPIVDEPRKRGFAAMDPEKRKEIASRGGKTAHERGVAHQFSADEARAAGTKGGLAPHASRGRKAAPR